MQHVKVFCEILDHRCDTLQDNSKLACQLMITDQPRYRETLQLGTS